jgi:transposase-like protein
MSKRRFTEEQINEMLMNKNVAKCSDKAISYNKDFKIEAVKLYQNEGMSANQIFKEAGFNLDMIGREVPKDLLYDWTRIFETKGIDGLLIETRGKSNGGGRPKTKWSTDKERIKYLETQVAYLKAENDFLAKLRKKSLN